MSSKNKTRKEGKRNDFKSDMKPDLLPSDISQERGVETGLAASSPLLSNEDKTGTASCLDSSHYHG